MTAVFQVLYVHLNANILVVSFEDSYGIEIQYNLKLMPCPLSLCHELHYGKWRIQPAEFAYGISCFDLGNPSLNLSLLSSAYSVLAFHSYWKHFICLTQICLSHRVARSSWVSDKLLLKQENFIQMWNGTTKTSPQSFCSCMSTGMFVRLMGYLSKYCLPIIIESFPIISSSSFITLLSSTHTLKTSGPELVLTETKH